ncbi:Foldase protein PrsA precursor [Stieleria bergensis]|uniref:peptidylprolyl isomerase n=1 Tax=Stieleria bergensis TaxID=2528025 RepID=A0A517SSB6_9BACT|nr:Foldase protein PrsA precursor [Planctomycetes bacterium SV_7m_r]
MAIRTRYRLQKICLLAACTAFSLLPNIASAQGNEGNTTVAVVNADPINRQMLADAALQRYGHSVLDNVIINRQLILQACQEKGVGISEQEVSEEIGRLATKFGFDVPTYLKLLKDERDIDPGRYSREIIWPMLALRKLVADQVEPTPEEFSQAMASEYGESIKCRIFVANTKEEAQKYLQQAQANPANFEDLVKQASVDEASASVGGLIPPIRRYTGDTRLEEAAFALKDGQISQILPIANQFVFLQAVGRIPAYTPPGEAMPAIRETITDRIRNKKLKVAASDLFEELQRKANLVKVLGNPELTKQHPGVAAIINGQPITLATVAAECVKRHGDEVLEGEINRKLLSHALRAASKTINQEDLNSEMARAAATYGFLKADGSTDLQGWVEYVTKENDTPYEIYLSDAVWPSVALRKLVEDKVTVTQEDLDRGFEGSYGKRVEILACVLSDQRTAQKIWQMARDNPSEEFFGRLAAQYSIEPVSASNSGKVPPIRKYSGQPALEREAFRLKPGELSGIVAVGDKYILLKCQGHTKPLVSDIEAVEPELRRDLTEKKFAIAMAQELDRLKANSEVENFFTAAKEIAKAVPAQQTR